MTPENFAYWLKGFFELTDSKTLTHNQILMIKEHLNLVFDKKTPNIDINPVDVWMGVKTKPICATEPSTSKVVNPLDTKITCDGVQSTSNLDVTLLCSKESSGKQDVTVDEHAHAGQAKRVPMDDLVKINNLEVC